MNASTDKKNEKRAFNIANLHDKFVGTSTMNKWPEWKRNLALGKPVKS